MLEGLEKVDWAAINHSHGLATEFPEWIRALTSEDEKIRNEALDNIVSFSRHQDSFYEVTPYHIPFLIELLTYEPVKEKHEILFHLMALLSIAEQHLRQGAGTVEYARLSMRVYDAIEDGYSVFIDLLNQGESTSRRQVAELLVWMSSRGHEIAAILKERLSYESDEKVEITLINCLSRILESTPDNAVGKNRQPYLEFFVSLLDENISDDLKFEAASAVARIWWPSAFLQSPIPQKVIDLLNNRYRQLYSDDSAQARFQKDRLLKLFNNLRILPSEN